MQCYRRAHDTRPHCRLKSLFSGTPVNTHIIFILPESRVPELHEVAQSIRRRRVGGSERRDPVEVLWVITSRMMQNSHEIREFV